MVSILSSSPAVVSPGMPKSTKFNDSASMLLEIWKSLAYPCSMLFPMSMVPNASILSLASLRLIVPSKNSSTISTVLSLHTLREHSLAHTEYSPLERLLFQTTLLYLLPDYRTPLHCSARQYE